MVPKQATRSDPCLDSLQQRESVQSLSARIGMGTVQASALAGRALEPVANALRYPAFIKILQGIQLSKVSKGAEFTKQLPLVPDSVSELASSQ